MRARESRLTEAAPEIPAKASTDSLAESDLTDEDRMAAFVAGYEQGKAERVKVEIEDQVQARLHRISLEALGMARRLARAKGPAWAAMITEAGERP